MRCAAAGATAVAEDTDQVVVTGKVRSGAGSGSGGAFVRLLDATGEFTAEVVSSAEGDFRFYAAPGSWTVRALHPRRQGPVGRVRVRSGVAPVDIAVA
ncbi:DUF1416 domain-containing protein [Saccharopolyspora gregorii]|uniref:DUF1416 domain-containing protein n=1 Tax=Saccharopolyspora gregorii TaxID=33914 RepID=A0ABP6S2V7_9PSEU